MSKSQNTSSSVTQSGRSRLNNESNESSRFAGTNNSSAYTVRITPNASLQTGTLTSHNYSAYESVRSSYKSSSSQNSQPEGIRLMPFKAKEVMEMIRNNPAYRDKSPMMINVKENDIEQMIRHKKVGSGFKLSQSPNQLMQQPITVNTVNTPQYFDEIVKDMDQPIMEKMSSSSPRQYFDESVKDLDKPTRENVSTRLPREYFDEKTKIEPFDFSRETNKSTRMYANNNIQAFPAAVGTGGFRSARDRSRRASRRPKRVLGRSRSRIRPRKISRGRSVQRRRGRSPVRRFSVRRSPIRKSPIRRIPARSLPRQMRDRRGLRGPAYCSPFPLCDNECVVRSPIYSFDHKFLQPALSRPDLQVPGYAVSRPGIRGPIRSRSRIKVPPNGVRSRSGIRAPPHGTRSRSGIRAPPYAIRSRHGIQAPEQVRLSSRPAFKHGMTCTCNVCMEKLQFIQPSVCGKRKFIWTNEYAVIPKPQVNLIDPCEELDRSIYPLADNPCIRDGHGNPLTDCIGRPLRDPIGKKFLRFSANGSVMDTNFRGNFWTGQPPLCVKCPLPDCSCGPDTTHNWWMSCGYPIQPNMNPFFQQVVAAEHNMS